MEAVLVDKRIQKRSSEKDFLEAAIEKSWLKIAPFWPLKSLIAVNPLQGLEERPFESAVKEAGALFQQEGIPEPLEAVNRETIKWCQAFFDAGQAPIPLPFRQKGLYGAFRKLARYDSHLHQKSKEKRAWLKQLPPTAEEAIRDTLAKLRTPNEGYAPLLTELLVSLPGWASYVKYAGKWGGQVAIEKEYLALRLVLIYLLWPEAGRQAGGLLQPPKKTNSYLEQIEEAESSYHAKLLSALKTQHSSQELTKPDAQCVFCIDVRSEPFRRALESAGNFETFGFAGFFGLPVSIRNSVTGESYASCPVLLEPSHQVTEIYQESLFSQLIKRLKSLPQTLKFTLGPPFALVELLGPFMALAMFWRTFFPGRLAQSASKRAPLSNLDEISLEQQSAYAETALRMMGLTRNFAPVVLFCGHGSSTQNNPFASALDCGACGGNCGLSNARILTAILNQKAIRSVLEKRGIVIEENVRFFAAKHDTTTDQLTIERDPLSTPSHLEALAALEAVRSQNRAAVKRSRDWAEPRPEWGLAKNAAFIVGPRSLTQELALEGRAFLHSYDWKEDRDLSSLTTILTAPMVVAQWINGQYLFSTLDNVTFGAGSKVTQNITGKMGIIQGNGSDLMHGLPLQSLYQSDSKPYHEPMRLLSVVFAPPESVQKVIQKEQVLQKLIGNGWVKLASIDPRNAQVQLMNRELEWEVL